MKILLAEDEHELSRALTAVLEHSDYKVTAVYNGEDAVAEAKKSAYDCFIFDIMMPVKDGITALSEIRDAGDTTPAIFLTARLPAWMPAPMIISRSHLPCKSLWPV